MPKMEEKALTWQQKFVTNPANALTTSRIVLSGVVIWLDLTGYPWTALALFVIAGATDWLDGYVAKRFGYGTDWGKAYDPAADKIMTLSLLAMIVVQAWHEAGVSVALTLICSLAVLVIREVDVAILKKRHWKRTGKVTSAIQSGRVAMVLMCIAIGVLLLPDSGEWWHFLPLLVAFAASMFAWTQYRRRYGR